MGDVKYFEQKLYKSLNIPITRLEPAQGFTIGRTNEITRDEIKFNKFIEKLRNKFSTLFDELMERQLALKGIASIDEWKELREQIHYDFLKDNNFSELREAELMAARLQLMSQVDPYVGTYFSRAWVKKHVLQFDEEGIGRMQLEIEQERIQAEEEAAQAAAEQAAIQQQQMMAQQQAAAAGAGSEEQQAAALQQLMQQSQQAQQ